MVFESLRVISDIQVILFFFVNQLLAFRLVNTVCGVYQSESCVIVLTGG